MTTARKLNTLCHIGSCLEVTAFMPQMLKCQKKITILGLEPSFALIKNVYKSKPKKQSRAPMKSNPNLFDIDYPKFGRYENRLKYVTNYLHHPEENYVLRHCLHIVLIVASFTFFIDCVDCGGMLFFLPIKTDYFANSFENVQCNYLLHICYLASWFGRRQRRNFRLSSQATTCLLVCLTRWWFHTVPFIGKRQAGKV